MRRHILSQPVMRRFVPVVGVSSLGDGMSMVAVAWLALQIAPPAHKGIWTALALAAFSLPATAGAYLFRNTVRGWPGVRLVVADATVRGVVLGLTAVLAITQTLSPLAYVVLLGVSSLPHAWGNAVATLGAQQTLLLSGVLTIALGAVVFGVFALSAVRPGRTRTAHQARARSPEVPLDAR